MIGLTRREALIGLAIAASTSDALALDQVKVSVYQSVSDAGIYIAKDRGYFQQEGIGIELIQLDSVSSLVTALASGQTDVAGGAPSAAIYNSARQGIGIQIVADKGSMPKGHGYLGLVVRKGLEGTVKSIVDLKGHRVAWSGIGSGTTNEPALDHLLRSAGLKETDVITENLTFTDSLAALGSGSVDAAYLIEPLVQAAEQRNIGTLITPGDQIYPNQQVAVLLYGSELVRKRADVASRFMLAYLKGVRDYNNAFIKGHDRAAIVDILVKNTSVKRPELYEKMIMPGLNPNGSVNIEGMNADMEWFLAKGYLKQTVEMSKVVDHSFIDAAVKQLGPYT